MTDLAAVILAGGNASRFGGDKASYRIEGRAMISRVHEALSPLADRIMVSVGRAEQAPEGLDFVVDTFQGRGPLAGIDAALAAANSVWLLVVACDMPYLTADALRPLIDARLDDVNAIVATDSSGRVHPLCACYNSSIRPTVHDRLERGLLSIHGLLDSLPTVLNVTLPDLALINVNQKPDLR
ncbi:MAG: molybdenum cofactor guanylyltransferase [Rhodothermales bacterium]